ncbi:death domain-containing immune deficiency protein [Calliopsis andreniformis]|uniref:death domain-containing immune deficiency protein n=1 Tax=Calliopsis andreniformis TaxID=337506 RepID=UPI003FCECC8C
MPIFSDLSRRFHMLTTDAKPDPPRIEIKGYTHNLNSDAVNDETKGKAESVPVMSKDTTSSEIKDNLPNGAVPTNTNASASERDCDDSKCSASYTKQHKKPNIKTKTKSKQSQGTRVVNYNIINSNGVKIGSKTSYICNINQFSMKHEASSDKSWNKSEIRQMPAKVEHLCSCTDEITLRDIFIIKTHIGHGWRDVARRLLYSDGQIEQFEENYRFRGISEVIYQIFLDWKQANTKDAKIGNLVNVLWTCEEYDCAERLVTFRAQSSQ